MLKPFHVIATPDENGYTVTISENPNVSARCVDAADIIPTATAAKEQDEQNRTNRTGRKEPLFARNAERHIQVIRQRHSRQQNRDLPGLRDTSGICHRLVQSGNAG